MFFWSRDEDGKRNTQLVTSIDKSIVIGGKARLMKMEKTKKLLESSIDGKIATTGEDEKGNSWVFLVTKACWTLMQKMMSKNWLGKDLYGRKC